MATLNVADLSPVQLEVWQLEQDYWALTKERDVEGLVALAHDRVTVWPHVAPLPVADRAHFRDGQRTRCERDPVAAYELSCHAVEVHGDAAIVYYAVATSTAPLDGTPEKRRCICITHIWIKDHGEWRLAGGMSRSAG
jgi:ketosteroid isomerase-like protein